MPKNEKLSNGIKGHKSMVHFVSNNVGYSVRKKNSPTKMCNKFQHKNRADWIQYFCIVSK